MPVHGTPQPLKVEPLLGVAVSVTLEPSGNVPEQLPLVQDSPVGLLLTVPLPPPANGTFKARDGGGSNAKVALTETEDVERAITHEPVPLQPPPLQPENVLPLLDAAVSVTEVS